ncbi:MAG: hypothetical protein KC503_02970 [Myxococcales bacterium]|nr:hypothetical protein [Myxococcales bacterium]
MAAHEELFLDTHSVSPSLFIGLGGSGSSIVDRIAEKLSRRWNWAQYERLVHFFAIDTNISDLERVGNVPPGNRILVSDFDKRAYVEQKRGSRHMAADDFFTQWIHDWYNFRATRGSGAGQIRIESRLSLAYQLERDRGEIIKRLNAAIYEAKDHDNAFRRNAPRRFNAFIYGSLAGGTGSGAFLPLAYLLQELIDMAGWIPRVVGTLLMPSLFHQVVKGALRPDIDANGYAALQELEHMMKLGYEEAGGSDAFHYNPERRHEPEVESMPFSFVYVVDLPAAMSIAAYREAVADSSYLQLFSPIIGTQQGEYDNYEKHQKQLAHDFTVHYGSYGCSVLVLPDDDLLEYCAMRYAKKAMEAYLTFRLPERAGEVVNQFAVDYDDPKFRAMSEERRNKVIDDKFREFVRYLGRVEKDSDNPDGPFSTIVKRCERRDKMAHALPPQFDTTVDTLVREAKDAVSVHTITPVDITAKNIKVDAEVDDLRRELAASRQAVIGLRDAHVQNIENGNFMRAFFEEQKVDPFCQRYFLIGLVDHLRGRLEEIDNKRKELERYEVDSDYVRNELKNKKELLAKTAEYTLMERLKRRNADFEEARADFVRFFNEELAHVGRMLLELEFQREVFSALLSSASGLLDVYRAVTARAAEMIAALGRECERLLTTAETAGGASEAHEYVLDVEALQDFSGRRHWDAYFDQFIGSGEAELAMFDRSAIFSAMNDAFAPRIDERGRRVVPTADEVSDELQAAFIKMGSERLEASIKGTRAGGTDRKLKGLLLDDALRLEARYYLTAQLRRDRSTAEPTEEMIEDYIVRKLRFCADKAAVLATIDESLTSDQAVVAASDIYLVGLHRHFTGPDAASLEPALAKATTGYQLLDGWDDEKRVVFYRAVLGVPLYFYRRVTGEMKSAYHRTAQKKGKSYPLHIDCRWEESLQSLDPEDLKAERREQEQKGALSDFGWAQVAGVVSRGDSGFRWVYGEYSGELGATYHSAFEAFVALDTRTAERVREATATAREEALSGSLADVRASIERHIRELDDQAWELEQKKARGHKQEIEMISKLQAAFKQQLESLG